MGRHPLNITVEKRVSAAQAAPSLANVVPFNARSTTREVRTHHVHPLIENSDAAAVGSGRGMHKRLVRTKWCHH
jgi:hypothetical protein